MESHKNRLYEYGYKAIINCKEILLGKVIRSKFRNHHLIIRSKMGKKLGHLALGVVTQSPREDGLFYTKFGIIIEITE